MKQVYLCALYILLGFTTPILSQDINRGSRITALGNSGVALGDVWSMQSNQAGLTVLTRPTASISYRNSFLDPEISTQSAVVAYPLQRTVLGLSLQKYGFSAYKEQKLGLACARTFGPGLSLALGFDLFQTEIEQYGAESSLAAELGLQYHLNERLTFGSQVSNINVGMAGRKSEYRLPIIYEFGAAYKFSDKVLLNSGFVNAPGNTSDFKLGLEYAAIKVLALRGGFGVNPFQQYAGFGCQLDKVKIDGAVSSHPLLGYSPQIALGYEF
jgi:hypothetical protein